MLCCLTALKLQDDNYTTDGIIYCFFGTQGNSNEVINLHVSKKILSLPAVPCFIAIGLTLRKEHLLSIAAIRGKEEVKCFIFVTTKRKKKKKENICFS